MLERADVLHQFAGSPSVYRVPVADPDLRAYSAAVAELARLLGGDDGPEGEWADVDRGARAARWRILTVPLPAAHPALGLSAHAAQLRRWAAIAGDVHGQHAGQGISRVADLLDALLARESSPLIESAISELGLAPHPRLVVKARSYESAVHDYLEGRAVDADVLNADAASDREPGELACVIGVTRWFPAHLATAPRTRYTAFVHHDWIHEDDAVGGLFGSARGGLSVRVRWIGSGPLVQEAADVELAPLWEAITRQGPPGPEGGEDVPAIMFLVAGRKRVLLQDEPAASVYVVEPGAPAGARVRRERVQRLEVGDFVLLRTDYGADDAIRVLADELLGTAASALRAQQRRWKEQLAAKVGEHGFVKVSQELERSGVSARNLRGWLSPDSIRSEKRRDFELILAYCGLGDEALSIWREMGRLDDAHLRAGQRLRRLLEDQIENADLGAVRRTGYLDVTLPTAQASGTLGIFRIEAIAPSTQAVPPTWLKVPQDLAADLWPE